MDWQPIDTAPKDGRPVLVCSTHVELPEAHKAWFVSNGEEEYWSLVDPISGLGKVGWIEDPTNWMPLPAPPKAD